MNVSTKSFNASTKSTVEYLSDFPPDGRPLKIFCGTWNMGNAKGENIDSFIPKNGLDYDIIAIGVQESTYKTNIGPNTPKSQRKQGPASIKRVASKRFDTAIQDIGESFDPSIGLCIDQFAAVLGTDFFEVEHASRFQMQLVVFARTKFMNHITFAEKAAENTGIMHIIPNKVGYSSFRIVMG